MLSLTAPLTPTRFLMSLVRPYAGRLFLGAVVTVISTLAMLSLPQFLKHMFDEALTNQNEHELTYLAMGMLLAVVIMVGGVYARVWLITLVVNKMFLDLRNQLTTKVLSLDVAFFEMRASGEILSRLVSDGTLIREFMLNAIPMLIRGILLTLGTFVVLFMISMKLTFILLGAALPLALVLRGIGFELREIGRVQQENIATYSAIIEESIDHVRILHGFNQHTMTQGRLMAKIHDVMIVSNRNAMLKGLNIALTVFIGFLSLIGVFWVGGLDVMSGHMTVGQMMAFILYLAFLADGVSNLSEFWPSLQSTLGSTERLVQLLDTHPTITPPARPTDLPKLKRQNARAVAFKNVTFAYESRPDVKVADGISFTAKAGQKVAIVGPSGAGKSTLFSLILRFYDVTRGSVSLDGIDVRKLSFEALRGAVAVVAQDPAIFSTTVRENVAYGRPDADDEDVWAALRVAHADGFVNDLPHGLNTLVGEKGVQLSGGQRQRLAIARAVLVDAPILLLDEATSHLDAESERAVQEALEAAGKGRTVITIAHRLSTVKAADCIYVMDKGRLVAHGTHAELMTSSPLYKALATLQMA